MDFFVPRLAVGYCPKNKQIPLNKSLLVPWEDPLHLPQINQVTLNQHSAASSLPSLDPFTISHERCPASISLTSLGIRLMYLCPPMIHMVAASQSILGTSLAHACFAASESPELYQR